MLTAVAYCRLSREDGDDDVSTSIINQKKIIEDYARANDIFIKEFYIDDGCSGYTMERPGFNKLKNDLNNDKIHTIIVKDLSRLGRNSPKVQFFLENILEVGKRLIAIGDNYDSYNTQTHDMVGIQTWVNEKYVRDVSNKIRKSINTMQKEGRYISSVPYGYYIDPLQKGVYHIDETCAMYVKEMFEMYLSGLGVGAIATNFTQRNIPTGSMITKQRLERQGKTYKGHVGTKWAPNVIMTMLKNDFYIGTLTLGKTKKRSINGKKVKQPEEKHYIFENAHEPIIDKATFHLVQKIIVERTANKFRGKRIQTRPNIFTGVLYCADCDTRMTSVSNNANTRYVCKTYNLYGTSLCTSHSIVESELKEALIYFLEHCRDNLGEAIQDLDKLIKETVNKQSGNIIETLEADLQRVELEIRVLAEQKMRETMKNPLMTETIDEMYSQITNEKYAQINSLKTQLQDHKANTIPKHDMLQDLNSAMDIINKIIDTNIITKRQITTILDKIVVHEDGGLDIFLKGNLHELCTNYVQMKNTNKGKILKTTLDYIENHQERFSQTSAYNYVRIYHRIGYDSYVRIFNMLQEYFEPNEGYNKGYRLRVPFEKLKNDFEYHIIDYDSSWVRKNHVTLEMIINICKWVQELQYLQRYKKNVF